MRWILNDSAINFAILKHLGSETVPYKMSNVFAKVVMMAIIYIWAFAGFLFKKLKKGSILLLMDESFGFAKIFMMVINVKIVQLSLFYIMIYVFHHASPVMVNVGKHIAMWSYVSPVQWGSQCQHVSFARSGTKRKHVRLVIICTLIHPWLKGWTKFYLILVLLIARTVMRALVILKEWTDTVLIVR